MARDMKLLQKERDLLQARAESLEADLQRERGLHRRELRKKAKDVHEAFEELAHSREQIRELKLHIRQLMDELEASSRYVSSSDRIRSTYGRPPGSRPRPSVPSGARYGTRQDPLPRSRETSRGRDTSSRERERTTSQRYPPSRPSSAPSARSGPRFDPTEYVRAKRERDRMLLERARSSPGSSRNLTPQRSAASTPPRAYSPVSSRPHSAERGVGAYGVRGGAGGGYSPTSRGGYSPSSSRPTSGLDRGTAARPDRVRGGAGMTSSPYADPLVLPRSRAGSPSSGGTGARRPAWGSGMEAWSKFPEPGGRPKSRPESAEHSTSPGRALQEVKNRLSSYMTSRSSAESQPSNLPPIHQPALGPGSGSSAAATAESQRSQQQRAPPPKVFDDATTEIADIDTRLHALQNFLKMAKSSGGRAAS